MKTTCSYWVRRGVLAEFAIDSSCQNQFCSQTIVIWCMWGHKWNMWAWNLWLSIILSHSFVKHWKLDVDIYFLINSTTFILTYFPSKLLFHSKADGNEMLITLVLNIYTPILIFSVITFVTFTFPIFPHSQLFHPLYTWTVLELK